MQKLLICRFFFTCICVSVWATNGVKDELSIERCHTNRPYPQLLSANFSQNALCYKTMLYSHALALNSSNAPYNIIAQISPGYLAPGSIQPVHNDSWITILDCCEGYKRNVTNNICMPVCTYGCQENSYCSLPEMCSCKLGYEEVDGQCEPFCFNGCKNGECVAPGVCRCKPGTSPNDYNECVGACEEEGCVYGTCRAGVCTCYEHPNTYNDRESCVLHCPAACSGECPALNVCKCRPGFTQSIFGQCVSLADPPQCKYGCGPNGRCISSNECECDQGFRTSFLTGRCVRDDGNIMAMNECQHPCLNGYCTGPDQCTCNQGYTHDTDDLTRCVPVCEGGCFV